MVVEYTYTTKFIRILPPEGAVKTKLTITIDRDLLPRAKRYARSKGVSLSELIEAGLREVSGDDAGPSFSSRWRGAFEVAEHGDDPRASALARKYL